MENLMAKLETEIVPALQVISESLGDIDDTHGQQLLLQRVIDQLLGHCETSK